MQDGMLGDMHGSKKTKFKAGEHRALGSRPGTNCEPQTPTHTLSERVWTTHNILVHNFLGYTCVQLGDANCAQGIVVPMPDTSVLLKHGTPGTSARILNDPRISHDQHCQENV